MKHQRPTLPHLIILFTIVLASCRTGLSVPKMSSDEPLLAPTTNPVYATKGMTGASGSEATTVIDALTYYIANELAHIGWPGNKHDAPFMKRFKSICPEDLWHLELNYKPRNAAAAGIRKPKE